MITRDQLIEIGVYNKPHGIKGEISATLDCDTDLIDRFSCLVSDIDGIFVPFYVNYKRDKNHTTTLLTIDGFANEKDVAVLVNKLIFVLKSEYDRLAEQFDDEGDDSLPVDYFIGFNIEDDGKLIGTVVEVDTSTVNMLFVAEKPDGEQTLIPAADDLIDDIDLEKRIISMTLPDNLLDLS